jgi:asparagine synthase (glutamine-hydrolysing)
VRELLPPEILARPKHGFGVPLADWFGRDFGPLAREVLTDPRALSRGWFEPRAVEALVSNPSSQEGRRERHLWALVCLELWCQTYLDRPASAAAAPMTEIPARIANGKGAVAS